MKIFLGLFGSSIKKKQVTKLPNTVYNKMYYNFSLVQALKLNTMP